MMDDMHLVFEHSAGWNNEKVWLEQLHCHSAEDDSGGEACSRVLLMGKGYIVSV
jgi:hypothetical protein